MKYKMRKVVNLGPIKLNFTQKGFSSWSLKIGPFRWNSKTRKKHLDTPGPGGLEW